MAMHPRAIWHGTQDESFELLEAVQRNCTCRVLNGKTLSTCAAHRMLAEDQRAVDGLLFGRNIVTHLVDEEFMIHCSSDAGRGPDPGD